MKRDIIIDIVMGWAWMITGVVGFVMIVSGSGGDKRLLDSFYFMVIGYLLARE